MSPINKLLRNIEWRNGLISLAVAIAAYVLLPVDMPEGARRMFFIFVIAAFFWAFEVLPLYATAVLVVVLEIFMLARPGGVLGMDKGGYQEFMLPFGSPIIFLFFGGFVLAKAMARYHIDRLIALKLLSVFGKKPIMIMCGFMLATAFLSMWMSNTATTAMMMVMVMPLVAQMDKADPFRRGLVLSIPFAANIGGIGTPVGTPPNAVAIGILENSGVYLSFVGWMKMAVPLMIILLVFALFLIAFMFPSNKDEIHLDIESDFKYSKSAIATMFIGVSAVGLWLSSEWHQIPAAVVALLAACVLLATGLLSRDDFKGIEWDVLVLMWGGLALGKGMSLSGLTDWLVKLPFFSQEGLMLIVIFSFMSLVLGTFMSHTATANLLVPIVMSIPGQNHVLLAVTVAVASSFAMALPISTPPNAIAFATDAIRTKDMIKTGIIISAVAYIIMLLGFQIVIPAAFGF